MVSQKVREKYIALGGIAAVEHEAAFNKEELHVASVSTKNGIYFPGKHYGMYSCFSTITQWTYGTKEDLLFILGVVSSYTNEAKIVKEKVYKLAENDTLEEMKRIGKMEGVPIVAETEGEAYSKYFNNSNKFMGGNYFYHFRMGRILFHKCEAMVEGEKT